MTPKAMPAIIRPKETSFVINSGLKELEPKRTCERSASPSLMPLIIADKSYNKRYYKLVLCSDHSLDAIFRDKNTFCCHSKQYLNKVIIELKAISSVMRTKNTSGHH